MDESPNRPEISGQCFAAGLVERSDQILDCLAGDFFDFFVFHFAFSREVIWFLQPGQRNQSLSGREDRGGQIYTAGTDSNGRDSNRLAWRDRVQAETPRAAESRVLG